MRIELQQSIMESRIIRPGRSCLGKRSSTQARLSSTRNRRIRNPWKSSRNSLEYAHSSRTPSDGALLHLSVLLAGNLNGVGMVLEMTLTPDGRVRIRPPAWRRAARGRDLANRQYA